MKNTIIIFSLGIFFSLKASAGVPPTQMIKEKSGFFSTWFQKDQQYLDTQKILRNVVFNTSNGILIVEIKNPEKGDFHLIILDENKKPMVQEEIEHKGKDLVKTYDLSDLPCNEYTIYITQHDKAKIHKLTI